MKIRLLLFIAIVTSCKFSAAQNKSYVRFFTKPVDARVTMDNAAMSGHDTLLDAGMHIYTITADYYIPFHDTITVALNRVSILRKKLKMTPELIQYRHDYKMTKIKRNVCYLILPATVWMILNPIKNYNYYKDRSEEIYSLAAVYKNTLETDMSGIVFNASMSYKILKSDYDAAVNRANKERKKIHTTIAVGCIATAALKIASIHFFKYPVINDNPVSWTGLSYDGNTLQTGFSIDISK